MTRTLKRILLAAFALLVVAVLVYSFIPRPIEVELARASRGELQVTVDQEGKTRIRERYVVSAPLAGRLLRVAHKEGDPVEAGRTLLAVIEPTDPALLDARARAEARARVSGAQAAVERASDEVDRAETMLGSARVDYQHLLDASENNAVTQKELDDARYLVQTREAELSAAKFGQEIAQFELKQAEAALIAATPAPADGADGAGETAPARFEIRAPCGGRVLRVLQESATIVNPGTAIVEVGDPADLELVIDVLSTDAVRITPGDRILVEQWGGEDVLTARVRLIEPAAFTKVSALGVEEQRVNVIGDFVDPPERWRTLGDAYRIEARIVVWEGENVLKVPTGALFRHERQWAVFVVREGRAAVQEITLGHRNGLEAEVLSGLDEAAEVIVHPSDRVVDGARVVRR